MATSVHQFRSPEKSIGKIDAQAVARLIAASADVALVLDGKGIIRDISLHDEQMKQEGEANWLGRPWIDTVTVESRPKIEQILREANAHSFVKSREVNHRSPGGDDIPIRYSAVQLGGPDHIVALGHDLRTIARLQQRLVDAQRAVERDYLRLRSAETRYRLLFQLSSEAVLIVEASSLKMVDVNPSASTLLEATSGRLVGKPVTEAFQETSRDPVLSLLESVRSGGQTESARVRLANDQECLIAASLFRQDETAHILIRLTLPSDQREALGIRSQVTQIVDAMPDGFVITDRDRLILDSNAAFLAMVEMSSPAQLRGQSLDRWLGRASVETNVLFSNLREHGAVRQFVTVIRNDYGVAEEVEISGVSVAGGETPCYGLVIHPLRGRAPDFGTTQRGEMGRSAGQLSELVGRVPLKDLVRETTELTERLCIEASLKLTGDNRAAAAQMLGLSRQSLYSKLRRYQLGDLNFDEDMN